MSGTWNFCFDASQVAPKAMSLQQSQVVVRFGCGFNVLGIQKKTTLEERLYRLTAHKS